MYRRKSWAIKLPGPEKYSAESALISRGALIIDNGDEVEQDQAWADGLGGALIWGLAMLIEYYPLLIIAEDHIKIPPSLYNVNAFFIAVSIAAFAGFTARLTGARITEAVERKGDAKGANIALKAVAVIDAMHTGFKWTLFGAMVWAVAIAVIMIVVPAGWDNLGALAAVGYMGALGLLLFFAAGFVFSLGKKNLRSIRSRSAQG